MYELSHSIGKHFERTRKVPSGCSTLLTDEEQRYAKRTSSRLEPVSAPPTIDRPLQGDANDATITPSLLTWSASETHLAWW